MKGLKEAAIAYRKEHALGYLKKLFGAYYERHPPVLPDRLSEREWGFIPFGGMMTRHIRLYKGEEVRELFHRNTPRHAYYSAAFYERPDAPNMADKDWLGAELIFDLDADHLRGAEEMTYEEQLMGVKEEVRKLLEKYILDLYGFDVEKVDLYFSGGRGYHIHVRDPKVYGLTTKERREIVDFILGTGLDYDWVFPEKPLDKSTYYDRRSGRRHVNVRNIRGMPEPGSPGWRGIMADGIRGFLNRLDRMDEDEALSFLKDLVDSHELRDNAGRRYRKGTIGKTYQDLFEGKRGKRRADKLKDGVFEVFSSNRYRDFFIELIKTEAKVSLAGETDEPVTIDTHRLIRTPGSLHGKTGFKVTPIDISELDYFDPLRDTVVLPERKMVVECLEDVRITLKGNTFEIEPGPLELPTYAAAYLIASGRAVLPRKRRGR